MASSPDRSQRSLLELQASAASVRTFSLHAIWKQFGDDPEYRAKPFFKSTILNRSIIVKHRLRDGERDLMQDGRHTVTKVILPIDITDLRLGARSFFVGQSGYRQFLDDVAAPGCGGEHSVDEQMLSILDRMPSLDPFLMREALAREGLHPARLYFDLSQGDLRRVQGFVQKEVMPLVGISFGDVQVLDAQRSQRFAQLLLHETEDQSLDPLRRALSMQPIDFREGLFCWKGFIYYKWTLADLLPKVKPVLTGLGQVKPFGMCSHDDQVYIESARSRIVRWTLDACNQVRDTLQVYEDAYRKMTHERNPSAFRRFLSEAPSMFNALGERLGAVNHIVSFWTYRFPPNTRVRVSAEELTDLLADFETGIRPTSAAWGAGCRPPA
jgi:hypothetical protein